MAPAANTIGSGRVTRDHHVRTLDAWAIRRVRSYVSVRTRSGRWRGAVAISQLRMRSSAYRSVIIV